MQIIDLLMPAAQDDGWFVDHVSELMLIGHVLDGGSVPPEMLALGTEDTDLPIAEVLDAIVTLAKDGRPIDVVEVLRELRSWGCRPGGGHALVLADALTLIGNTPLSEPRRWVNETLDAFSRRRRERLLVSGAQRLKSGEDAAQIIDDINEQSKRAESKAADSGDVREAVKKYLRAGGRRGDPTCFPMIDKFTGGRRRGELTVIAARPGAGKSIMAMQEAIATMRAGKRVLYWTLENSKEQTIARALSHMALVDYGKIRDSRLSNVEQDMITTSMAEIHDSHTQWKLYGADTGWSAGRICAAARTANGENPANLIIIDPLSHVVDDSGSEDRLDMRIGGQVNQFKRLALDLDCHVILLHHLNRQADSGRPTKASLKNSGVTEETADILIFLWTEDARQKDNVTAIIEKARDGETGQVEMIMAGARMRFDEVRR